MRRVRPLRQFATFVVLVFLLSFLGVVMGQPKVEQWDRFEVTLKYAHSGNSFKDVRLLAVFTGKDTSFVVNGFYDGKNAFKIRFMPQQIGVWSYATSSNIPELNENHGTFECIKATGRNHGMVRVSDTYNFKYADGKPYYPFGTTAYAWIHMKEGVQELTLRTLKNTGFNKVRMCVLPKNYDLVKLVEECPNPLQLADVSRDHRTSTAGKGYYIIYFGTEMNESWLFSLPIKNAKYEKLKPGTRFKVEVIDAWNMTIQTYPLTFETTPEIDYRVFDKDFKKVWLPLKPYVALRITETVN